MYIFPNIYIDLYSAEVPHAVMGKFNIQGQNIIGEVPWTRVATEWTKGWIHSDGPVNSDTQ